MRIFRISTISFLIVTFIFSNQLLAAGPIGKTYAFNLTVACDNFTVGDQDFLDVGTLTYNKDGSTVYKARTVTRDFITGELYDGPIECTTEIGGTIVEKFGTGTKTTFDVGSTCIGENKFGQFMFTTGPGTQEVICEAGAQRCIYSDSLLETEVVVFSNGAEFPRACRRDGYLIRIGNSNQFNDD
jgi:hypothetical protein